MGNSEAVGGALKHPFVLGSSFSQKLVNNVRETVTTWKGIPLSPQLGEVPNGKKSVLIFPASRKLGKNPSGTRSLRHCASVNTKPPLTVVFLAICDNHLSR